MPKFDDLVTDIYGLFGDNVVNIDEKHLLNYSDALVSMKRTRLNRENKENYLRMSNLGKPDRQLWYDINWKGETEKIAPQGFIKFMYGDILEQMVIFLAKTAGHEITDEQAEVEVGGIKGHIDCIIDGVVVDVKSAATHMFSKFETGDLQVILNDPFLSVYVGQIAGYVEALGNDQDGAFLAIDKTLGKLCTLRIPNEVLRQINIRNRIEHAKHMVKQDSPPEKCYTPKPDGKSGNFVLATGCSYCKHKFHCWSDANNGDGLRAYYYANGPKYFTHVEKEPRVERIEPF